MAKHIFISYSRKDQAAVDKTIARLEAEGFTVWVDREGIQAGNKWRGQIVEAIRTCRAFLVFLTPNATRSENVMREIDLAEKYLRPIIPVDLEFATLPAEFAYQLVGLQRIDLSTPTGFDQLTAAIRKPPKRSPMVRGGADEALTGKTRLRAALVGLVIGLVVALILGMIKDKTVDINPIYYLPLYIVSSAISTAHAAAVSVKNRERLIWVLTIAVGFGLLGVAYSSLSATGLLEWPYSEQIDQFWLGWVLGGLLGPYIHILFRGK